MGEDHGSRIREAGTSDAPSIRQLIHETIHASYQGVYPPRAVEYFLEFHSEERILERLAQGASRCVAAGTQWTDEDGCGGIRSDR